MSIVTVEEVVSKYVLDPSAYQRGATAVVQASKTATDAVGGAFRTVGQNARAGMAAAGVGIAGLGAGLGAFAKSSIQSALAFDTMERSLRAVTGSAARAKAVLGFVDKLAIPSIFTSAELAESAKTLEAFGLATERFLPIAEKLGTVFGGTSADLRQFVDSLGMIKGGRFGEAFESLARAGISRDALKAKGLQFDKGGSFLGDINQALNAVEQVVNERFGKLSQEMASGPAAKMGSVMDAWGRATRATGAVMLDVLIPVAERLGDTLQKLVDNGTVTKIAKGFGQLFDSKGIANSLSDAFTKMVAKLGELPSILQANASVFDTIKTAIGDTAKAVVKLAPALQTAAEFGRKLLDVFTSLPDWAQKSLVQMAIMHKVMGGFGLSGLGGLGKSAIDLVKGGGLSGIGSALSGGLRNVKDFFVLVGSGNAASAFSVLAASLKESQAGSLKLASGVGGLTPMFGLAAAAIAAFGIALYDAMQKWKNAELDNFSRTQNWADRPVMPSDLLKEWKRLNPHATKAEIESQRRKYEKMSIPSRNKEDWDKAHPSQKDRDAVAVKASNAAEETAKNTALIAQNTQKMADINDRVLGGGTIGGRGLSRQDLRDLHTGSGPKSEVHRAVDNLANVILTTMTKTSMSNIGKQTTRREV